MELLADRDPEEARKILDPVLEHMMEAVHRYEGTVNQVMGDGIMALFGAPLAHEDHAVRACYAALRMQESVAQYAEGVFRTHGVPVQIRVGLNSGEVVVRAIGSDLHMDYTGVGQTTHLAARMEQMAMPGTILLAPATLQLAEGYVQVAARGPVAVKGLAEPMEIYVLTGASAQRTRLHAAAARGMTRLVGRDAETQQLYRSLERALDGHGQLVALVGEPGVGKSRLVYELTHSQRAADWLILEAGCVSYGKATSYLPVIDLLKAYFKVHDRETHHDIRQKVTGKLLTLDRTLEPIVPAVLALLDVPVDDPFWQALDPAQRRQRTLDAVKRLLLRESRNHPLLIILEDLHWIDTETQALLNSLVENVPSARLLVLVNYRPEYEHHWGGKTFYTQIRLDPLPSESARELLRGLLGGDATVAALGSLLIERTQGNPFFLEESLRSLVETGALAGERGAYRLATALTDVQIPATVQAILGARIDRLAPNTKRLLQSAAVIGKDVPFALLATVVDTPQDDLRRGLVDLRAGEFLYETCLFPDAEYTFKHALTHEVAYRSVLKDRRRELHAGTVEAIERLYGSALAEHTERLVDHAVRGEVWSKAAAYATQAGTRAIDRSAEPQVAKACFETALEALSHLPRSREILQQGVEVRFLLGSALFTLGATDAYLSYSAEAVAIAEQLGDTEQLSRALALQTNAFWVVGDNARALTSARRAAAIAEEAGHRVHKIHAWTNLGLVCRSVGDYNQAITLFAKVVEMLPDSQDPERLGRVLYPAVNARCVLASACMELGQFDRAAVIYDDALRLAERIGHRTTLLVTRLDLGQALVHRAAFDDAIPRLEAANHALREAGLIPYLIRGLAHLGYALAMTGRIADGIALLCEALELTTRSRRTDEARSMTYLAEAYLRGGQLVKARDLAERALVLSRQRVERGTEASVMYVLGAIESHTATGGDDAKARHYYTAAMALADELGMRPLVARCHLGLAKLYRRTGKHEQAHEHLSTANSMYRDIGMTYWLEKAEAEFGA
jgi:class 3 adenylate cyclase/tetratricopeptide (TPR) repeat protein